MIWYDSETYSATPLKSGIYRYAANCEAMIISYAADDGEIKVWDRTADKRMPGDLAYMIHDTDEPIVAHNAMFDRTALRLGDMKLDIPVERWRCTMVQALAHSLPGALDKLCTILNVANDKRKLKEGHDLIQLFCKPRPKNAKIERATRHTHPAEWAKFLEYAGMDIVAMREIARKMPTWNYRDEELALYHLDQRINDRGMCVDTTLAEAAIRAVAREQKKLAAQTHEITKGAVASTTQRDLLLGYLLVEFGVDLPDLTAATIERRIEDPDLPPELKTLLGYRLQAATVSPSKYKALMNGVNADGRLRGTKQFNGAMRTGRWAGRVFQPDNLPRPSMSQADIEAGIDAMLADCADLVVPDVMALASSAIRGSIIAAPGNKLCVGDLSNIEGRMCAWLAGEEWKLQAFRDFDAGRGHDLYKLSYARSFNVSPDFDHKTKAGYLMRQIGKVEELMLQYEGGVGAFVTGAATYGIDLDAMAAAVLPTLPADIIAKATEFLEWTREQKRPTFGLADKTFIACDSIKRLWRSAHPMIVSLWPDLKEAVISAIASPGETFTVRKVKIAVNGAWLRIRLPSGRYLCYPSPRTDGDRVSYMGVNQYTRRWQRVHTYGGKLLENITQAASRDVLAHGMKIADAECYPIVLTVHDEIVAETPDNELFSVAALCRLMSIVPHWAPGLPLAAAGYEAKRYKKE